MITQPAGPAPLPFEAESVDVLRLRYQAAVAPLVNLSDIVEGLRVRPSAERQHVFDCPDGMRLIVSREIDGDGNIGVHMSASLSAHGDAYERLKLKKDAGGDAVKEFLAKAVGRWGLLSGPMVSVAVDGTWNPCRNRLLLRLLQP